MYRSWEDLIVTDDHQLRDPARIKKLVRARGSVNWLVIGGFSLGGLVSLFLAGLFVFLFQQGVVKAAPAAACVLVMTAMAGASFYAANAFLKEKDLDILRLYLKDPGECEFVYGTIDKAVYRAGEKRNLDTMLIEGAGKSVAGKELIFFEEFHPSAWPFATKDGESSLKKGDDWYDMKGKRPTLPVAVHLICRRLEPKWAMLVGIDEGVLPGSRV